MWSTTGKQIKVPAATDAHRASREGLADRILKAVDTNPQVVVSVLEHAINGRVYGLCVFSKGDIDIIERVITQAPRDLGEK